MSQVAIIHYNAIEVYPPICNILSALSNNQKVVVYTHYNTNGYATFASENAEIKRYSAINKTDGAIAKLIKYVKFYWGTTFCLFMQKPTNILYYETMSCLPAYLYKLAYRKTKIYIHYHEYVSPNEYIMGPKILRWMHNIEKKIYSSAVWISHTNEQRMNMFLKDEKLCDSSKFNIFPNYPPKCWNGILKQKNIVVTTPIKIVYIGALGLKAMYVKEFAYWVNNQKGKYIWDIYTVQTDSEVAAFFHELQSPYITVKGAVEYNDIPQTIIENKYKVGVILYNGHIPNYIYNAPNKLFEYLACGLDVWLPQIMEGCKPYLTANTTPKVLSYDFNNLEHSMKTNQYDDHIIQMSETTHNYFAEDAMQPLLTSIFN